MKVTQRLWWLPFGRVPEVGAEELAQALFTKDPPQVLDVRTHGEWLGGHIAGAIHVPILELAERLPDLALDHDRPVVAICLSAHRSIPAVRLLLAGGFPKAAQLHGGMRAWRGADLPEVKGE